MAATAPPYLRCRRPPVVHRPLPQSGMRLVHHLLRYSCRLCGATTCSAAAPFRSFQHIIPGRLGWYIYNDPTLSSALLLPAFVPSHRPLFHHSIFALISGLCLYIRITPELCLLDQFPPLLPPPAPTERDQQYLLSSQQPTQSIYLKLPTHLP